MSQGKNRLPPRSEIAAQYTWKVEDIYQDETAWERDYQGLEHLLPQLQMFKGTLANSPGQLLKCLQAQEQAQKIFTKVFSYSSRRKDEDTTNPAFVAMNDRSRNLAIKLRSALSWFVPELLTLKPDKLQSYLQEEPSLAVYQQMLDEIIRQRPHVLSTEMEYLLSQAGQVAQAPSIIFNTFNDADITFPSIKDEQGGELEVTKGRYVRLLESKDRRVRRQAFETTYSSYWAVKNTLAAILASSVRKDLFFAKARGYQSSLHAATFPDNVSVEVYDNLISTVHHNLDKLHKYVSLRKQVLGLNELHMYDLYLPIVKDFDLEISFEQACELVVDALEPFGVDYQATVRRAVQERWIDVYENAGKTSGAYSAGVYGVHPYILLNFQNNIKSTFTLAHELGHAMHSWLSQAHQPFVYSGYSLFVAEVASTVHEVLLTYRLLQKTKNPMEKAYYLNNYLEGFRGTLFRQTMFAEFEQRIHAAVAEGQALTPDYMCQLYHELNVQYYGPDVVVDKDIDMEWARIPHFYRSFYVYKYATGYSAAVALAAQILREGKPAVDRYLAFLSSGSSDYPVNVLHKAGVDMSQPRPVQLAMDEFDRVVQELADLLK